MGNTFSVGINSHMAIVAFDKLMEFCEEYVKAVFDALYASIQNGTKEKPLGAPEFFEIRKKWALWLTQDMEEKLDGFEAAITKIGAEAQVYERDGVPAKNDRSIKIGLLSRICGLILAREGVPSCGTGRFPWLSRCGSRKNVWSPLESCC
jgi:hypothetical protein